MKNCCLAGLGLASGAQKEVLCPSFAYPGSLRGHRAERTQSGSIRASQPQLATWRCHVSGANMCIGPNLTAQQLTSDARTGVSGETKLPPESFRSG